MRHGKLFNELGNTREKSSERWNLCFIFSPKCRVKVTGKKKNFVINGILEAYLKAYPHKRPASKEPDDESNKAHNRKYEVC